MAKYRAACHQRRLSKPTLSGSLLLALLLLAGDCHCLTPLVSTSESSQTPFRLSNSAILHQHRKLQQHSYNISGADLDAKGTTDAHPRLQHHRQARSAPGFTNQSQPSHTHTNEPGISQVSRQQHGAVLESDTHAAVSDTRMSHFTQTDSVMEQVLYPNSPQWRQNDTQWHHVHESYVEQLASGQRFDLIMYGDSIFESLLGSVVGNPVERAAGLPEVWSQFHNSDTDKIFALAGDGASDMVWRLKNGETPAAGQVKQIVLLIGSNDLDYYWDNLTDLTQRAQSVKNVVASITQCIDILASGCPGSEIFVMSLMHKGVRWLKPEEVHVLPNRFTPAIDAINEELKRASESWPGGHVQIVDCSYFFVNHDMEGNPVGMNSDLVPDTLHPNPIGFHKVLTECIEPGFHRTVSDSQISA